MPVGFFAVCAVAALVLRRTFLKGAIKSVVAS
jgi:hypothetical protein